mmetsp:Transcript_24557/g.36156  ORF Transcript_24557/g.36156 Transcript_24557/m.36156 type:complete len:109 (-) Transcript_24557:2483-2809(-)
MAVLNSNNKPTYLLAKSFFTIIARIIAPTSQYHYLPYVVLSISHSRRVTMVMIMYVLTPYTRLILNFAGPGLPVDDPLELVLVPFRTMSIFFERRLEDIDGSGATMDV